LPDKYNSKATANTCGSYFQTVVKHHLLSKNPFLMFSKNVNLIPHSMLLSSTVTKLGILSSMFIRKKTLNSKINISKN